MRWRGDKVEKLGGEGWAAFDYPPNCPRCNNKDVKYPSWNGTLGYYRQGVDINVEKAGPQFLWRDRGTRTKLALCWPSGPQALSAQPHWWLRRGESQGCRNVCSRRLNFLKN